VAAPEAVGGGGGGPLDAAVVWEEQSYALVTGPGFSLHSDIVAPYLLRYGSDAQKKEYLPRMATGACISAIAMTEPGAGSDLAGVRTTARREAAGGDWRVSGSKTYITNGGNCDMVIVVAKTDADRGAHGVSLFLVDTHLPGVSKGQPLEKLGLRAQDTSELFFDDVRLPPGALLGELNRGFYHLMRELPQERLLIAAMAVASAEAVFELTRTYVKERAAFGTTLVRMQTVAHALAALKTDLAAARALVDASLRLLHEGRLDAVSASMAKIAATECQGRVVDKAVQLHGGMGFMWASPVCRAFADARVQRIYGGANEVLLELISRSL
jgi:long-chain-acyl-CoA dehydrogenase